MRRHQRFHAGRFVLVPTPLMAGNTGFAHQAASHMSPDTMPLGFQDVHLAIHSTLDALDLVQVVTEHIAARVGLDEGLRRTVAAARAGS